MFYRLLIPVYQLLIIAVPFGIAATPFLLEMPLWGRIAYLFLAPLVYGISYVLLCGLLSRPFRSGIQEGKFERSLNNPVYCRRRLHALCWTSIYYSPGYAYFLAFPKLRALLFRLFGYRGSLDFTCYPDTWLRDLPVLQIGSGTYLSNKSTLATNLVLTDGRILVGAIHLGKNVMVGHLAVIGAGIHMGDGAEFSHTSICGCRVTLGQHAIVKPGCGLDHSCEIGERSEVGSRSYVGMGASIGSDVHVPPGSVIPRRSRIRTQAEMDQWRALETKELVELRLQLAQRIQSSDE